MMAREVEKCPIPVVSRSFCFPDSIDLEISKTVEGSFGMKDASGNLIFTVKNQSNRERVILDAAGLPILTLRFKAMSMHNKLKVFRGESTNDKDLIFSAGRSSMFQLKPKIHVFLANNTSGDVSDYTIRGLWYNRSCKVYARDASTIVAQMHKGKDKFMMKVFPNIDHVFIVALIVIVDELYSSSYNYSSSDGGTGSKPVCYEFPSTHRSASSESVVCSSLNVNMGM